MVSFKTDYITVGGNRNPAAASWDVKTGLLAYGADNNIAIWNPNDPEQRGVRALLTGHSDTVNTVRFCSSSAIEGRLIISGSVDKTVRVWKQDLSASTPECPVFTHATTLKGHEGSVNCVTFDEETNLCASGAADGTVRIWALEKQQDGGVEGKLLETIVLKPRFFPLAIALRSVPSKGDGHSVVLAVGGTRTSIQLYVSQDATSTPPSFQLSASLVGHEAWIRSLEFNGAQADDFYLASASQDKYIRLWRIRAGEPVRNEKNRDQELIGTLEKTLTNKTYSFNMAESKYSVTFEALLFGHEDWIYTLQWNPNPQTPQLLSASADNSLVIWEPDPVSGVWFSAHRMGEISVQKGSTTATGSAGGFWIGLWSPSGDEVVCLGRTGSWRRWAYDKVSDIWVEQVGISGHVRSCNGIEWEPHGAYLLSTSSDQTTRLHAEWKRDGKSSWHEFSRPQIHGYDLNCLASISTSRFVSGADEKLLRVFEETRVIAHLLQKLSGFSQEKAEQLPEAANIPVLGLSNKALDDEIPAGDEEGEQESSELPSASQVSALLNLNHPPFEDHLSKFSLWPEHEKLYGHGYEISAVAPSNDRRLIATACKASSIDHAVIRLYDTTTWVEIRPPLTAHSLTITSLAFSPDDRYLASVGRDRQWTVFERDEHDPTTYKLLTSHPKGHTRMILDVCWAPTKTPVFATAGRDKAVNVWKLEGAQASLVTTVKTTSPVSAIACFHAVVQDKVLLAIGENSGQVSIHSLNAETLEVSGEPAIVPAAEIPSKSITQVVWRPVAEEVNVLQLAVSSEDTSARIYAIDGLVQ
ncbi:WD40 repeat-like-containing domain protein [Ascosphaera apis ARSEF 7405]|uniref:Elongator complex protein 2 n=1 Tax=Ascosphaera apis ARSEF 7405 TaxID=392613 RepID=A0A167Y8T8_9EURO|nr:WD40 repeat-like-containing domain protein [Ascosphaera apis ARSEF 7405]